MSIQCRVDFERPFVYAVVEAFASTWPQVGMLAGSYRNVDVDHLKSCIASLSRARARQGMAIAKEYIARDIQPFAPAISDNGSPLFGLIAEEFQGHYFLIDGTHRAYAASVCLGMTQLRVLVLNRTQPVPPPSGLVPLAKLSTTARSRPFHEIFLNFDRDRMRPMTDVLGVAASIYRTRSTIRRTGDT